MNPAAIRLIGLPPREDVRQCSFVLHTILTLFAWIAGTSLAAASGAVTARTAGEFYGRLNRPHWAPPAWLFGPAWTVLYLLMAVAAWRVWRIDGFSGAWTELTLYGIQLLLNAAWSWFFFVRRTGVAATVEVVLLWLFVLATLLAFWSRDPVAGALFVPYLMWVSFAAALTVSVWRRNPSLL
jgi:tryptophan-rich sensory protein